MKAYSPSSPIIWIHTCAFQLSKRDSRHSFCKLGTFKKRELEAATGGGCSIKNLFLKVSQYAPENNCVEVPF